MCPSFSWVSGRLLCGPQLWPNGSWVSFGTADRQQVTRAPQGYLFAKETDMNHPDYVADYNQTSAYFRELHETRFRLLALLPLAAGGAIALLPQHTSAQQQVALGAFGLLITIGLTIYDQRNTMIYDRLVRRAQFLEKRMRFAPLQLATGSTARSWGGPFSDRPGRRHLVKTQRLAIPLIWHDLGLSIVYAGTLAGWAFLLFHGMSRRDIGDGAPSLLSSDALLASCAIGFLGFVILCILARLNDKENDAIDAWIQSENASTKEPN
jgi:hypothetical protein